MALPLLIFCHEPFAPKTIDEAYQQEYDAAKALGFEVLLLDFEALTAGQTDGAIQGLKTQTLERRAIYRGWMLKPEQYNLFFEYLLDHKIRLINDFEAYLFSHYLPCSYSTIEKHTFPTLWIDLPEFEHDFEKVHEALMAFKQNPVVLKDYVKSAKHAWKEACFIPDPSIAEAAEQRIERFMELRGDDFEQGLVFRQYFELESIGEHPESGMPLSKECRCFIYHGKVLAAANYWAEVDYPLEIPDLSPYAKEMARIPTPFYTMDLAKSTSGKWYIVELGDAQMAELPGTIEPQQFYQTLAEATA